MKLMNWLAQVYSVTLMNLRAMPGRTSSTIVSVVGIAGVVAVFVAVLSIGAGFQKTLSTTGSDDVAVVLRAGADSEMSSGLNQESVRLVAEAPGLAMGEAGALSSAELYVVVAVPKRGLDSPANVPLRGVGEAAFEIRERFQIVEGRNFTPGLNEIIVGRGASREFAGLELGARVDWAGNLWNVVGIFEDGGSLSESEVWTDVRVLQGAFNRGNTFQTVRVRLQDKDSFTLFKDALTADPRLNVLVEREADFYADQSAVLTGLINGIGSVIAGLMGLGAIFGAILTMYSAVAARSREIATLRALGFGAIPIVISVLVEALLLGMVGGVIGGILAYIGFNGYQTSTLNWQSFSQVTFAFAVTLPLMISGFVYALAMGLFGGLLPSIKAARQPITTGLREA